MLVTPCLTDLDAMGAGMTAGAARQRCRPQKTAASSRMTAGASGRNRLVPVVATAAVAARMRPVFDPVMTMVVVVVGTARGGPPLHRRPE